MYAAPSAPSAPWTGGDTGSTLRVAEAWAWLRSVGSSLSDAIKSELLLSCLAGQGAQAALRLLSALGSPAYLNGQFIVRYLWSTLNLGKYLVQLQQFVTLMAADPECRARYGSRHVLMRLMSRLDETKEMEVVGIEGLNSFFLLRRIKSVDDVNDLLSLGWRPNVCTLMEHAQVHSLDKIIRRLAPAVWSDLSTTIPVWLDSPHDPASADAPGLDSHTEFWAGAPEYWIASQDQIRLQAASISTIRATKMQLMNSSDMQRMLALVHKSPTLLRHAWAKKSLTWLNYILLYKPDHFHTMLQVLLQPPLPRPPCMCPIFRLNNLITNIKQRQKRGFRGPGAGAGAGAGDVGPRGHACETEYPTLLTHAQQCAPWYRVAPPATNDPDRFDQITATLSERKLLKSPYSLNQRGRTVAIAHFLILLNAKGVTATSIQILGDVAAHWPHTPPIKDLRPLLAKMHTLSQLLCKPNPPPAATAPAAPTTTNRTITIADAARGAAATATACIVSDVKNGAGGGGGAGGAGGAAAGGGGLAEVATVFGTLGKAGNVQSHLLYQNPKNAPLTAALKKVHLALADATSKSAFAQPLKLQNEQCQLLREIYDSTYRIFFDQHSLLV